MACTVSKSWLQRAPAGDTPKPWLLSLHQRSEYLCLLKTATFLKLKLPKHLTPKHCSIVVAEGGISPAPSNRIATISFAPNVVTFGGKALNTTVWLTCYRIVNMTVPIPASAGSKANIKYEQNDSIAGTLLHSTFQVNHCRPTANIESQLFCSLRHQPSAKRVATGNTQLDFSFAVMYKNGRDGWWRMLTFLSHRSAGRRGFLLCAL